MASETVPGPACTKMQHRTYLGPAKLRIRVHTDPLSQECGHLSLQLIAATRFFAVSTRKGEFAFKAEPKRITTANPRIKQAVARLCLSLVREMALNLPACQEDQPEWLWHFHLVSNRIEGGINHLVCSLASRFVGSI